MSSKPNLKASEGSREIPRPSNSQPKKSVAIISYLDYPYPAGLSRRIESFVVGLQNENFPTRVISPIFRSSRKPSHSGSFKVDLSFLKILGTEGLAIKIVALALFNLFAFFRILASRREFLAVQYESVYSFPAALLAKIFCGCASIGDDVLILGRSKWAAALVRALACTTDLMLCSTQSMVSRWSGKTRALYVPNGISPRFIAKRHLVNLGRLNIVFVGALSYHANMRAVEHIVKASSRLHGECEFLVVGSPIPEKHAQSGVRFLGQLDDDALLRLYTEANVGALPFFGVAAEGPKIKVLEYMAAQLLVVSSPEGIAGYPDLVAWEHYVPAASVEEFVQILRDAPRNANQYARIVMRGHEFATTHYRWSDLLNRYVEFMDRLMCSEEERCLKSTEHESGAYLEARKPT